MQARKADPPNPGELIPLCVQDWAATRQASGNLALAKDGSSGGVMFVPIA
jgi:hypothetical protein